MTRFRVYELGVVKRLTLGQTMTFNNGRDMLLTYRKM
jgi:hypothetical protein